MVDINYVLWNHITLQGYGLFQGEIKRKGLNNVPEAF
jgi:hypothetical protein